ncbi:hypothetical protein [Herbaspirillum sp. RV1423]|uniref:hypothetical protein n=1 Tax=Herbaspirillum sp. RV1423 TaxID=1443993 RepID=UPI001E5D2852|nr:hypothetical protein [Herbaspirillum sp. RV1423]
MSSFDLSLLNSSPPALDDEPDEENADNPPRGPLDPDVYVVSGDPKSNLRGIENWGSNRPLLTGQTENPGQTDDSAPRAAQSDSDDAESGIDEMIDQLGNLSFSGPARTSRNDSAFSSGSGGTRSSRNDSAYGSDVGGMPGFDDIPEDAPRPGGTTPQAGSSPSRRSSDASSAPDTQDNKRKGVPKWMKRVGSAVKKTLGQAGLYEFPEEEEDRKRRLAWDDERRRRSEDEFMDIKHQYDEQWRQAKERGEPPPPMPARLSTALQYGNEYSRARAEERAKEQANQERRRQEARQAWRNIATQIEHAQEKKKAESRARLESRHSKQNAMARQQHAEKRAAARETARRDLADYTTRSHHDIEVRKIESREQEASLRELMAPPPRRQIQNQPPAPAIADAESTPTPAITSAGSTSTPTIAAAGSTSQPMTVIESSPSPGPTRSVAAAVSSFADNALPNLSLSGGATSTARLNDALGLLPVTGSQRALRFADELSREVIATVNSPQGADRFTANAFGLVPGAPAPGPVTIVAYADNPDRMVGGGGTADMGSAVARPAAAGRVAVQVRMPVSSPSGSGSDSQALRSASGSNHRAIGGPSVNLPVVDSVSVHPHQNLANVRLRGLDGATADIRARGEITITDQRSGAQLRLNANESRSNPLGIEAPPNPRSIEAPPNPRSIEAPPAEPQPGPSRPSDSRR